jgi:hypothetical protein
LPKPPRSIWDIDDKQLIEVIRRHLVELRDRIPPALAGLQQSGAA